MKNPIFSISIFLLVLCFSLGAFAQEPTKPAEQQPPTPQNPIQKPTEPEDQGLLGKAIETTEVVVPVIVTDNYGRFVQGLKKADFAVREDGVSQVIEDFSDASSPFSVALLIDLSLSTKNKLEEIKRTATDFVKLLQPRDRVLVVAFDERVRFVGDFTGDQKELEKSIKSLKTSYLTSLYDAIDLTIREKLRNQKGRKAIVVLSDGVDSGSKKATYQSVMDLITRSGIIAYSVRYETRNDGSKQINPQDLPNLSGAPSVIKHMFPQQPRGTFQKQAPRDRDLLGIEFLRELAMRSGALYIRSESEIMTAGALNLIANEIRNQYTIVYDPKNKNQDGLFRQIHVNLNREDLQVRFRQGYVAPKAAPPKEADKTNNQ